MVVSYTTMAHPTITPPSVEQHSSGFGIGDDSPRLSWRFLTTSDNDVKGWKQTAYEIQIARHSRATETHQATGDASVLVPWPSEPLKSRESAQVRVRSYGTSDGRAPSGPTNWSPWATVECGFLARDDWIAVPITIPTQQTEDSPLRPVRFRKVFHLGDGAIDRARLYITSLGVYRAFINGHEVDNQCMAPG
jgi:alpha-L-rhamnosidase